MDRSVSASHSSSRTRASNMPRLLRTSASLYAMRSVAKPRIVAMYAAVHSLVNFLVANSRSTISKISNGKSPRPFRDPIAYGRKLFRTMPRSDEPQRTEA